MEKNYTVVVIDDNKINNFICEKIISSYSSAIKIESFLNPEEGLNYILDKKSKISVLLLDLNMPVFDGWEILNKMKEGKISIPTVILTSSLNREDKYRSQSYPIIVDFITKPATYDILTKIIEKNIRWD